MTPITASGGFSWFKLLHLPEHVDMPAIEIGGRILQKAGPMPLDPFYHSVLAVVILCVIALVANRALANRPTGPEGLVPEAKLSPRTFFELFCEGFAGFLSPLLGDKTKLYFPLLATLFLYILVCNLLGLVPGLLPPTGSISSNIGMAVVVFFVYNITGVRDQGLINYLKHFGGPVLWLAPLMFVIEIVSHVARPASLSIRLFGNMHGDHMVFDTFLHLSQGILIPVIFLTLGVFVSLIQALVFSLLSAVYISMAFHHEEEGAH